MDLAFGVVLTIDTDCTGDATEDVTKDEDRDAFSFLVPILLCGYVSSRKDGEVTGIYNGTPHFVETGGLEVLLRGGKWHILALM